MTDIIVDQVTKVFTDSKRGTDLLTLDRIDLAVAENEFLCLLGPSGCGKSTVLNMIAGFEKPTSGAVRVGGKTVTAPGADRGMVFQQPTLMPWLPVWENIAFHLRLAGRGKAERLAAAQPFIELVGLQGFEHHYPAELSGGMSQRVGIARALVMNPGVILMDEPFGALDEQTKMDMHVELIQIWQRHGGTIVFVTHGIDEALTLGTHVAIMSARPGRILEVIKLDMPRPRDITGARFIETKRHVLGLLRHGRDT
jgi:NitT/TauT family transport system ATP-binding protein